MEARDVPAVLELTAGAWEAAQWSHEDYERAASGEFDGWVAMSGDQLVGFVVARRMGDEVEILNLAVERAHRRRGLASQLLDAALEFARARGARCAFLEVRESNAGAMAFYRRRGLVPTARRPRYYSDPVEDAVVFTCKLGGVSA
jgi:ribosomal-protein-alanine N-acetyltransferase